MSSTMLNIFVIELLAIIAMIILPVVIKVK